MAFPGILRRLFANNGAGPLLRSDIIPLAMPKGLVAPFYRVTFGGSDGRRPIFWGKTAADEGWVLCDGGTDGEGGTVPNLKDRMIIGAGASYANGATGGATTHGHSLSGTVGGATLSVAQLASHSHTIAIAQNEEGNGQVEMGSAEVTTLQTKATGSSSSHNHSLSGSAPAASNLPPYYALAYILKL